jgi:hypothetical protein
MTNNNHPETGGVFLVSSSVSVSADEGFRLEGERNKDAAGKSLHFRNHCELCINGVYAACRVTA